MPFHRENQVIILEHNLAPEEILKLKIEYRGNIDENICGIEIPEETFIPTSFDFQNFGLQYVFDSEQLTILIPQVIWYPTTVSPVRLQNPTENNFTNYSLQVKKT